MTVTVTVTVTAVEDLLLLSACALRLFPLPTPLAPLPSHRCRQLRLCTYLFAAPLNPPRPLPLPQVEGCHNLKLPSGAPGTSDNSYCRVLWDGVDLGTTACLPGDRDPVVSSGTARSAVQ